MVSATTFFPSRSAEALPVSKQNRSELTHRVSRRCCHRHRRCVHSCGRVHLMSAAHLTAARPPTTASSRRRRRRGAASTTVTIIAAATVPGPPWSCRGAGTAAGTGTSLRRGCYTPASTPTVVVTRQPQEARG